MSIQMVVWVLCALSVVQSLTSIAVLVLIRMLWSRHDHLQASIGEMW